MSRLNEVLANIGIKCNGINDINKAIDCLKNNGCEMAFKAISPINILVDYRVYLCKQIRRLRIELEELKVTNL